MGGVTVDSINVDEIIDFEARRLCLRRSKVIDDAIQALKV